MRSTLALPSPVRTTTRITGADAIIRALEREAVSVCFGMPGGAILPLYDALARAPRCGTCSPATSRARATWRRATPAPAAAGVVFATSGPGATNLVTPIADARMDSTPLVCVTGQVRQHLIGTDAFQECDIVGVTAPLVKHAWQVLDASELAATVHEAFRVATSGRPGPVLVDVPRDVQEQLCDDSGDRPLPVPSRAAVRRSCARRGGAAARRGRFARHLRRRRRGQRRRGGGAAAAGGAPRRAGRDHADGQGRVPRVASAVRRAPRHARPQVRELGAEPRRPDRGRRRALRRPRHGPARRLRARRARRPPRRRPARDRQAAARRRGLVGDLRGGLRALAAASASGTRTAERSVWRARSTTGRVVPAARARDPSVRRAVPQALVRELQRRSRAAT